MLYGITRPQWVNANETKLLFDALESCLFCSKRLISFVFHPTDLPSADSVVALWFHPRVEHEARVVKSEHTEDPADCRVGEAFPLAVGAFLGNLEYKHLLQFCPGKKTSTYWPMGDVATILKMYSSNFLIRSVERILEQVLWNYSHVNVTEHLWNIYEKSTLVRVMAWYLVNIGSGNCLVLGQHWFG